MNEAIDISYWTLFFGYLILLVPLFLLWYFKTGLLKDTVIALIRMTIQLLLVGVYLSFLFEQNNYFLNAAWVLVMLVVAAWTVVKRSELPIKLFIVPIFLAGLLSVAILDIFFLGAVLDVKGGMDARYFIPITGMMLGNTIKVVIVALNAYYDKLVRQNVFYRWHLANGASKFEALLPFRRDAIKKSLNPVIANVAITGLIALPGAMTGQILGGSSPNLAIKYQIMLMIVTFSASILTVVFSMIIADRHVFDAFGNLKSYKKAKN